MNLFCKGDDLLLVKGNHRTEYRKCTHFIGCIQTLDRLGCHLTDAFPCNQCHGTILLGNGLRNPHHIPSHNDGQLLMWTLFINIQLDIRKIHNVQLNRSRIFCHQTCQFLYFLSGTLTGVWGRMEIDCINGHTPFGDHISCHRTVDSTGQQQCGTSGSAKRHPSRSLNLNGIHIDKLISHLYPQSQLRLVHVHLQFRIGI